VALLKEGADATKTNSEGILAIDLSPDKEVCSLHASYRYRELICVGEKLHKADDGK